MQDISVLHWLLLALAAAPAAIALRFGSLIERTPSHLAFQIAVATWLVCAALAQLDLGSGGTPLLLLSIATPSLLWVCVRYEAGSRAPWGLPVLVGVLATATALELPIDEREVALAHAAIAGLGAAFSASLRSLAATPGQAIALAATALLPMLIPLVCVLLSPASDASIPGWAYLPATVVLGRVLNARSIALSRTLDTGGALVFVNPTGRVIDATPAAYGLFEIVGTDRVALEAELVGIPPLRSILEDPTVECGEFFRGASASERRCFEVRVTATRNADLRTLAIFDVSAHRKSEGRLYHEAHFDSLTGLPNRRFLHKHLKEGLQKPQGSTVRLAVIYFDLDRFKSINDSFGHAVGDELLRIVAQRLRQHLRSCPRLVGIQATLARLSGDEFVVALPDPGPSSELAAVTEGMLAVLAEPVAIEGRTLWNAGSAGIARHPEDGDSAEALLRAADIALYHAKATTRGGYCFFRPELTEGARRKASIDRELRRAIASDELDVHLQPKYRLSDGALVGAEALLRWNGIELGNVGPTEFVPVAEEFGLIDALGRWVTDSVCARMARWRDQGFQLVPVSVNVSPLELAKGDVAKTIASSLQQHGLEPSCLEVELTESSILDDEEKAISNLLELQRIGVRISLDDFGTGYSSLRYLNAIPLDVLKLDRSFLRDLHQDPSAEAMVSGVIAMAHSLDLEVVAEGVDCEEMRKVLRRIGCDVIQGFASGPPMPEEEFVKLLEREKPQERSHPDRILVVDDGGDHLGVLAMRLNRIGFTAFYATAVDEGLLFAAEEGASIGALLLGAEADPAGLGLLVQRLKEVSGHPPCLIFAGAVQPLDKEHLDLGCGSRVWALREPLDDCLLRQVALAATSPLGPRDGERVEERTPVELIAKLDFGNQTDSVLIASLSAGGAFLETESLPPIGTGVTLSFHLEDIWACTEAEVLYHMTSPERGPLGCGVRFDDLEPEVAEAIRDIANQSSVRSLA